MLFARNVKSKIVLSRLKICTNATFHLKLHIQRCSRLYFNLARLYLLPAKLWILDEPFTAIDKSGVQAIETLLSHQAQKGGAVILTTHQELHNVPWLRKLELK